MSTAIGIDFGTTRCAVGIFEGGRAAALLQGKGTFVLPAAVGVDAGGQVVLGDRARRLALTQPGAMLMYVHRLLGRRFEAATPGAWRPTALARAEHGDAAVVVGGHPLLPQALLGALAQEVRAVAEEQLGESVAQAVVSVPVHFGDAQRRALIHACRLGGLEVRRLVHPTTAAALVYQSGRTAVEDEAIALLDMGGGGASCAVVEVSERGVEVLAQRGLDIGGEDIDGRVVEWLLAEFKEQSGIDAAGDPGARARLRDAAEKAKIALSERKDVTIDLPFLAADEAGPKHLHAKLTQARLEKLAGDLLGRVSELVARVLDESGRTPEQVREVFLLGGTARVPALHERVEAIFKKIPSGKLDAVDTVARGAAIYAGLLASRHPELRVTEVVAHPIYLQRGEGEPQLVFPRRAPVPGEHPEEVRTPGDGRPSQEVRVLQGERSASGEHELLASFTVSGQRQEVEVKFALDASQVLELSVREMLRGKEAKLHVRDRAGIPDEQLAAMVEAARARETELRAEREARERRQRLDAMLQRSERALSEQEKLTPEARASLEGAARDARAVLSSGDDALVTTAIEAFAAVLQPLGGELAALAAPPPPRVRLQPVVSAPPKVKADAAAIDLEAEAGDAEDED